MKSAIASIVSAGIRMGFGRVKRDGLLGFRKTSKPQAPSRLTRPSLIALNATKPRILAWIALIATVISIVRVPLPANSATLAYMEDVIGDPLIGASTDHAIAFVTPTGVDASTDTIILTFQSFDISTIGFGDIDFFHGTSTGYEHEATLAASAAAGVWGAAVAGQTVTFTAPTDAAADEVAASSTVRLRIGTNAAGGTNQIVNPVTPQNYVITFSGTFGDTGSMGIAVVDNNQVSVTASYPTPPPPAEGGNEGGHGTPSDTTPPTIMNVQAVNVSSTSARITWQTDELSTSSVDYGNTIAYASGTVVDASSVTSHAIDLTGLLSCATYHFRVSSTDGSGNTGSASGYTFATTCDVTPPVLSGIGAVSITDTSAILVWTTDEPATSVSDLGTTIAYGVHAEDGSLVTSHAMPVAGLQPGTTYHFRVTSVDARGNVSVSGDFTFQTLADTTPPANASLSAAPGDAAVQLTWTNPSDADFAGVIIVRNTSGFPASSTDGLLIYNGAGTSFTDSGLTNGTTYYYGAYAYDTNGNRASGSLASAAPVAPVVPPVTPPTSTPPEPPVTPPVEPPVVPPVTPPVTPPEPPPVVPPIVVPTTPAEGVTSTPPTPSATILVNFYSADGTLPLSSAESGDVGVRGGSTITVFVPVSSMNGTPSIVAFVLGSSTYNLAYDTAANAFVGRIVMPTAPGTYATKAQAIFMDGRVAEARVNLVVQGYGRVTERALLGGSQAGVPGAIVRLYTERSGAWVLWSGTAYGETNPKTTDANGYYAFDVPPGRYYAEVEKYGYERASTLPAFIGGNVFNGNVSLIRIPSPITEKVSEILASTSTPVEKAAAIIENVTANVAYEVKKFQQEVLESPEVQEATKTVVPPTAITVTAVNAASAFSIFNLLTYLQYLFTQPVLLFWRRKRKSFGTVYDALSKRPVDLAIIRLIHAQSGLTVQTRVTDKRGRYILTAKPGTYRIEIVKPTFVFPSTYMKGKLVDVDFSDLYHGDQFTVSEDTAISYNIPLDPPVAEEIPRRILLKRALRSLQHAVALSGVIVSIGAFLIAKSVPMAGFVLVQVTMYVLFRRLSLPEKPKKLGKVYDVLTNRPLQRAIVRIFDAKFNKLLETQITDSRGRYGFLVGRNVFYLTGEAKGYDQIRLPDLDLTKKGGGVVDREIPLMKKSWTPEGGQAAGEVVNPAADGPTSSTARPPEGQNNKTI